MKKYISILLIALVAITCLVSCDHEGSDNWVMSITVDTGTYYLKAADDLATTGAPSSDSIYIYSDRTCTKVFGIVCFSDENTHDGQDPSIYINITSSDHTLIEGYGLGYPTSIVTRENDILNFVVGEFSNSEVLVVIKEAFSLELTT